MRLSLAPLLLSLTLATGARGQTPTTTGRAGEGNGAGPGSEAASPVRDARGRLQWNEAWPRFQWWEAAGTAATYGALVYLQFGTNKRFSRARWEGGILFDDPVRDALRLSSASARERADTASDVFWYLAQAQPVVDLVLVGLVLNRNLDLAFQLAAIDAEVYGLTSLLSRSMHVLARRARPLKRECAEDPRYDSLCGGGSGGLASFWSGHTAMAAAGAGLTCVHHRYLPLYGDGPGGTVACVGGITAATVTGLLRVMNDRHYLSDVLVGGLVGFGIGYGLPWLLHYRHGNSQRPRRTTGLAPLAGPDRLGLALSGLF